MYARTAMEELPEVGWEARVDPDGLWKIDASYLFGSMMIRPRKDPDGLEVEKERIETCFLDQGYCTRVSSMLNVGFEFRSP